MDIVSVSYKDSVSGSQPLVALSPTEQVHLPLLGGDITLDESLMPHQQALDAFRQMQYSVPETAYQQQVDNDSLEGIQLRARTLLRENKRANDGYEEVRGLRSTKSYAAIENGRSHIKGLSGVIDNIHTDYQKKYGELIKASIQYMQDMNTALGSMSKYIEAGSDNKIKFKPGRFLASIDRTLSGYTNKEYNENGNYKEYFDGWDFRYKDTKPLLKLDYSPAAHDFWEKKLEGQGFVVRKHDQKIEIYPNLEYIQEVYKIVSKNPTDWKGGDISAQEFQSLQTAIDSQKSAINSSVSRLLETFRQDNSHFETLTQLLIQLYKDLHQYNNGYVNM
ncbi:TPA: IpaD/SipD/SspD family type III secretion system needle tip protein [Providencia rettgeri]